MENKWENRKWLKGALGNRPNHISRFRSRRLYSWLRIDPFLSKNIPILVLEAMLLFHSKAFSNLCRQQQKAPYNRYSDNNNSIRMNKHSSCYTYTIQAQALSLFQYRAVSYQNDERLVGNRLGPTKKDMVLGIYRNERAFYYTRKK